MKAQVNFDALGGGGANDIVAHVRSNSHYLQSNWRGSTVNQYKYMRLMTKAETTSAMDSATGDTITMTSASYHITSNGTASADQTITTTDIDVSTLNLGDTDILFIGGTPTTGWNAFCVYFHN